MPGSKGIEAGYGPGRLDAAAANVEACAYRGGAALNKFIMAVALFGSAAAFAQTDNFPNKPIRLVAPFPPGGSVDIVGRIVGAKLSQLIGQQVVIDNRSGASG